MGEMLQGEQPIKISATLAAAVGLNESIVLERLNDILKTPSAGITRDGAKWVSCSHYEWLEQFPFWSLNTVRRAIYSLRNMGLIATTNKYNSSKLDKTLWYSINYEQLDRLGGGQA